MSACVVVACIEFGSNITTNKEIETLPSNINALMHIYIYLHGYNETVKLLFAEFENSNGSENSMAKHLFCDIFVHFMWFCCHEH